MTHPLRGAVAALVLAVSVASLSGCALSTIATKSYQSQLVASANAKLKLQLADAEIAAASYAVANDGSYSGANVALLESNGFLASDVPAEFAVVVSQSGDAFCLQGATKYGQTIHVVGDGDFNAGACPA